MIMLFPLIIKKRYLSSNRAGNHQDDIYSITEKEIVKRINSLKKRKVIRKRRPRTTKPRKVQRTRRTPTKRVRTTRSRKTRR